MDEGVEAVLDASALIALLWEEPGGQAVEPLLGRSVISTVNLAEVLQRYRARGFALAGRRQDVEGLGITMSELSSEDAEVVADLWSHTRDAGLSLGDRACVALARRLGLPAYTADRAWGNVDLGVEVVLIR